MTDKAKVILNTHGGRLAGPAKVAQVEKGLQAAGLAYELETTDYPNHALELAAAATQAGWPLIVAVGGDGTINEVVNGMIQICGEAEELPTLGIIPLGTANDLADALSLPNQVTAVCQRLAAGQTRRIDVGVVNDRYFVNNSAVGLEPVVTLAHDRMRRVKGTTRYVLAALKAIFEARSWTVRLQWDAGVFEGPITLVSVGNSRRTGGAFYMTPQAQLDDGLLDFVYALSMSRWQMLKLLPLTFSGKHVQHRLVAYLQTKTLSIKISPPSPLQTDGEVIDKTVTKLQYRVLPQKLRVVV